jgi:hypothetical protein
LLEVVIELLRTTVGTLVAVVIKLSPAGWNIDASEVELLQTPVGTLTLIVEGVSSDEHIR